MLETRVTEGTFERGYLSDKGPKLLITSLFVETKLVETDFEDV